MLRRCLIFLLVLPLFVWAQDYPVRPDNYVTDKASVLSQEQIGQLNYKLKKFEDSTSIQLFVYLDATLNGRDIETLSQEIFHEWKIGQSGKNNGILITIIVEDHKFRIHTGYGMESILPDLLTKRIQDEHMRPLFKEENYYEGINAGIDQLIYYSKHEYKPEEFNQQADDIWSNTWFGYLVNVCMVLLIFYLLKRSNDKKQRTKTIMKILAILFAIIPCFGFFPLLVLTILSPDRKRGSSNWSSDSGSTWSSSASSSDSSSDSGFDGGGGGDSGGGGSSSDW